MARKNTKPAKQKRTMDAAIRVLGVEFPGKLQPKRFRVGGERRTRILDALIDSQIVDVVWIAPIPMSSSEMDCALAGDTV